MQAAAARIGLAGGSCQAVGACQNGAENKKSAAKEARKVKPPINAKRLFAYFANGVFAQPR
jgi:hypothetical protein